MSNHVNNIWNYAQELSCSPGLAAIASVQVNTEYREFDWEAPMTCPHYSYFHKWGTGPCKWLMVHGWSSYCSVNNEIMVKITWCPIGVEKRKFLFSVLKNSLNIFLKDVTVSVVEYPMIDIKTKYGKNSSGFQLIQLTIALSRLFGEHWPRTAGVTNKGDLHYFLQLGKEKKICQYFPTWERQELYLFPQLKICASSTCCSSFCKFVYVVIHMCKPAEKAHYPVYEFSQHLD